MSESKAMQPISDPYNCPVTFINDVAGIGFANGNINLTLSVARFTPCGDAVQSDLVIASRLRFDLYAAQQIHSMIGKILDENTKGAAQPRPKMDS